MARPVIDVYHWTSLTLLIPSYIFNISCTASCCVHTGVNSMPHGALTDINFMHHVVHTGVHSMPHGALTDINFMHHVVHTGVHSMPHGALTDINFMHHVVHTGVHSMLHVVCTQVHSLPNTTWPTWRCLRRR